MNLSKNLMKGFGFFFFLSALSSCNLHRLTVQTQYLTNENRASFYIGTPDPALTDSSTGQRLLVQWCLPNDLIEDKPVFVRIVIRLRNRQEREQIVSVCRQGGKFTRGFYPYDLTATDYYDSGGILTYRVEMLIDDRIIETWEHPLWANPIVFPEISSPSGK